MRLSPDPAGRRRLAALCATAAAATIAGVAVGAGGDDEPELTGPAAAPPAQRLPLERAVGQTLLMGFDGPSVPEYIRRRLRRGEGAGVILFGGNVAGAAELRGLTAELQAAAGGRALIATDQEGGSIRILAFAEPELSQSELPSAAAAADGARAAARDLRGAGINVNLAPVADVASAPGSVVAGRAYPGDAAAVARSVAASVRAHAAGNVAATVKHFPGIGAAATNTDVAPVTIDVSTERLDSGELVPFRAAIDAGAPLVMASHALYPGLDADRIASQSAPLLDGLLRERLGFRGVVITDSIEAEAVLVRSDVATAAERSIAAGADIVLMTGSGSWNLVYPRLLARARRDPAFRARVGEAAGRVLALKRRLGLRR